MIWRCSGKSRGNFVVIRFCALLRYLVESLQSLIIASQIRPPVLAGRVPGSSIIRASMCANHFRLRSNKYACMSYTSHASRRAQKNCTNRVSIIHGPDAYRRKKKKNEMKRHACREINRNNRARLFLFSGEKKGRNY